MINQLNKWTLTVISVLHAFRRVVQCITRFFDITVMNMHSFPFSVVLLHTVDKTADYKSQYMPSYSICMHFQLEQDGSFLFSCIFCSFKFTWWGF